jgi:hypothetical protein
MAHHPCRFGNCSMRQRLVALHRTARSCHRSSPTAGDPGNPLRAVLSPPVDYAPELSLTHPVMKIEVATKRYGQAVLLIVQDSLRCGLAQFKLCTHFL